MALSVILISSGQTFRAAFCDVAIADSPGFAQVFGAAFRIERIHLKRGRVDKKARSDELIVKAMVAEDVADVLAQKTFDALSKFLHAVNI